LPKVLVTDASDRAALAVIRSLGKKGIEVTAAESSSFNAGFLSRYCKHRALYAPPQRSKKKFVESILGLVKKERFDLLIPVTAFTVIPISENKEDLEKYVRVATPDYETVMKAFDKTQTIRIAAEYNIPCPRTFIIEDLRCVKKTAEEVNYPAVIKPRMKVIWTSDQAIMLKITHRNYAYNKSDLVVKYTRIAAILKKLGIKNCLPIVQEYIKGEGYGVEVLMHNLEPKALFMHRRLREYPISGGASTLRESVADENLMKLGVKLLKAMEWNGVAMVEFKVDKTDNQPKLLEVNGRLWGSLALAINAGIDFPFLMYSVMVKKENPSPPSYKKGVKQRWIIPGDVLWLVSSIFSSENKFGSIRDFVKAFTVKDDIMTLSDPAPFLGAIVDMAGDLIDVLTHRRSIEGETIPLNY